MKKLVILSAIAFFAFGAQAQECDSLVNVCYRYLATKSAGGRAYISDGQVYQAFVDAEQSAEFKVTLYGDSWYRIAASAGTKDNYVVFNVWDQDREHLLFSNDMNDMNNEPYWDFYIANTIDVYIEAYLDIDKKVSGCMVLLIGFNK